MGIELLTALAGGALGALATFAGLLHQRAKTRRNDWWKRFTWACEARSASDPAMAEAGRRILIELACDNQASEGERQAAMALLFPTHRVEDARADQHTC